MVDSSRSRPDTIYFGSLDQPLMVNGVQVAPSATPVRAKLLQLPNGAGFTLVLTDITIAGRQSALTSSQVAVSSNRTAQSNAVASALSQIPGAGGAAAKARAEREAAMRAQQQGNTSRQVLLSGTEVHVPPMTPLVFTLAGESVP
jgi:hypothetical protein